MQAGSSALRNRWKLRLQPEPAPSLNDIVAKLAAIALSEHPALGGRWEGDRIVLPTAIHIGIAVDTEHGLMVPVIRDVANLALEDVAQRSRSLIDAARRREIQAIDMKDGVFTISNLGSFGVEAFTPILNYPETAVLGLGAIRWEPVVLPSGQIVAREQMMLSLTFDHRVVDGAPAARFLQTLAALDRGASGGGSLPVAASTVGELFESFLQPVDHRLLVGVEARVFLPVHDAVHAVLHGDEFDGDASLLEKLHMQSCLIVRDGRVAECHE